jgi:hypothetical protein
MYNHWSVDNHDSVRAFEEIQHTVIPALISGDIIRIEKQDNEILVTIDQKAGIDYIRNDDTGLQGIAWRAQWGDKAWDTFTIRYKRYTGAETEYEKRIRQIREGYLYPAFTMQGYFDNRKDNKPLSVGIVRTVDLYQLIAEHPKLCHENKSDNQFKFVCWRDLGDSVKTWHGVADLKHTHARCTI